MSSIVLDPKRESLKITCGQCGDTYEIAFDKDGDELRIDIIQNEEPRDHAAECYVSPIHIVT